MKLIQALDFDINLPVSYLFLRRYSKVMNFTMPQVLTNKNRSRFLPPLNLADSGPLRARVEPDGVQIHRCPRLKNGQCHFPLVVASL